MEELNWAGAAAAAWWKKNKGNLAFEAALSGVSIWMQIVFFTFLLSGSCL